MCIDLIEKKIKQNVNVLSPREHLRKMGLSDVAIDKLIRLHGDSVLDIANTPIPLSSWHTWNNGDVIVVNLDMTTGRWISPPTLPQQNGKTYIGYDLE